MHEIVPFMQAAGLSLTVWSPLAGGFLSGKYTRENLTQSDNRRYRDLPNDRRNFAKRSGYMVTNPEGSQWIGFQPKALATSKVSMHGAIPSSGDDPLSI